jgi:Skp family chaperone for outer membrane proteins
LLIVGSYYVAIFLPQKQKASMEADRLELEAKKVDMEIVKLELEAKIEQEKTEQARMELAKQQAEEDKEKKLAEEAATAKKASAFSTQVAANKAKIQIQQCLDRVEDWYSDAASDITYSSNAMEVLTNLGTQRNQLRNECYK